MREPLALCVTIALIGADFPVFAQTKTSLTAQVVPAAPKRQPGRWAQDYTGRAADPAVRFGQLANGMRYAILRNETPKDAVSMRMLIRSGSLQERDDERGLAHYLEHMAFRGSANIADGDVVRILERQGLQFGADTNAGTNFDATVYQFDFPKADATAIDTGLTLFREIGGRLKIDPATVNAERGVILSEERLRDSGNLKAVQAQLRLTLPGTGVADRLPIGTIDSLNAATAAKLRRFYEANYRPENATIVIVGAVDVDAIEAQIKQRFGDWKGSGAADPPVPRTLKASDQRADTLIAPGVSDNLSLTWTRPPDPRADTEAREQDRILNFIGLTVLNLRLREAAQEKDAPFSFAAAGTSDVFGTAETTTLTISPTPGKWREALNAVVADQRRLVRDGISAADIARAVALARPGLQARVDAASTRNGAALANAIVLEAKNGDVFTSPVLELSSFDRIAKVATPASVTVAFRAAFGGDGPLAFRSASDPQSGDNAALQATLAEAENAPISVLTQAAAAAWPYASFGTAGTVRARATDADGVTKLTFANGVRLAVKPTKFDAGGVTVTVSFGRGIVGLSPAQAPNRWLLDFGAPAWLQGGTTKLSWAQMQRALEGHNVGLALGLGDTTLSLSGSTRTNELDFQMQLLAAYFSDSAYRADSVPRIKGQMTNQLAAIDSNSQAVLGRVLGPVTHNGDLRWKPLPTAEDLEATKAVDLAPLLEQAVKTPVDIVMVGDLTVDQAIAAVAPTFGALPKAPLAAAGLYKQSVPPLAPAKGPIIATHGGRADQAVVVQLWVTPDYYAAPEDSYALDVARSLLEGRLIENVREKLGLTYSPFVVAVQDLDLPRNGYFLAGIEVPPAKFDEFRKVLGEELAAMATKPIEPDALVRAKTPIIERQKKGIESNGYWVGRIGRLLRDPRATIIYRDQITAIERVTPADVQRVLNRYVIGKKPLAIEIRPRATP